MTTVFYQENIPENLQIHLLLNGNQSLIVDRRILIIRSQKLASVIKFLETVAIDAIKCLPVTKIKLAAMKEVVSWMHSGSYSLPERGRYYNTLVSDTYQAAILLELPKLIETMKERILEDLQQTPGNRRLMYPMGTIKEIAKVNIDNDGQDLSLPVQLGVAAHKGTAWGAGDSFDRFDAESYRDFGSFLAYCQNLYLQEAVCGDCQKILVERKAYDA
ncbi:hypothetical protein TWF281_000088 [Arthrobotrys megalospora]